MIPLSFITDLFSKFFDIATEVIIWNKSCIYKNDAGSSNIPVLIKIYLKFILQPLKQTFLLNVSIKCFSFVLELLLWSCSRNDHILPAFSESNQLIRILLIICSTLYAFLECLFLIKLGP